MEDTYGCNLINTKHDGRQVKEFVGKYHVHILVRQGQMTFSDGKNSFTSRQGDLAIWQMFQIECHPYAQREHWQEMASLNQEKQWDWSLFYISMQLIRSFSSDYYHFVDN